MRLLHTSDWHLGRSFHQVGLLDAQAGFVDHLVEVVRQERVDAVLVSGDVYDRALPAPDTVALLSETVSRLVGAGAQVVLSSGNHDSAIRLGFAADLLERSGLHIRSSVDSIGRPVEVGGVAVYPLPYLEPSLTADPLGASARTHAAVLEAAMARVASDRAERGLPSVVMAHAFVTGGASSDSERDITVGGVCAVHPRVFAGTDYVALGHLHGQQQIDESVRYSGSPVAMSFSEARHTKGSWLVDVDAGGRVRCEQVPAPVHRPLAVLRGALEDLLADPRHAAAEQAWCQVTLTDPVRPLGAMDQVRRRFPHTLALLFDPQGAPVLASSYAARVTEKPALDLCCDFLAHVRSGHGPAEAEREVLAQAVEAARLGRSGRDGEGTAGGAVAGGPRPGAASEGVA
ncbi:MAG TPA: exonuclease SbcCD subunit D [Pedococcus sp.]